MFNKIKIFFISKILLIIVLSLIPNILSIQEYIYTKDCNFSVNDPDFGVWDPVNEKGVFMTAINLNQNLYNKFLL